MAAHMMAAGYVSTILTILCALLALSDQIPVNSYTREKDFLDAFGEWLRQAQATKNVQSRSDPSIAFPAQVNQLEDLALQTSNSGRPQFFDGEWLEVPNWPTEDTELGQIGGVATNLDDNLVVFHRGDHDWKEDTFDDNNVYTGDRESPIAASSVVTMDKSTGTVLDSWGSNKFFLPHGLEIDAEGNFWMTDVALHQVFKFGPDKGEPLLTLGVPFEPALSNDDGERFCKPTDVAVSSNGEFFFVADGYCNSRVLKYSRDGTLVGVLGQGDSWVPHSLALVEDLDLICVADRENRRILCYNAGIQQPHMLGYPDRAYVDENNMGRVYAIEYSPKDGYLYAVMAPTDGLPGTGFTVDMYEPDTNQDVIAVWTPAEQEFTLPHDIALSKDNDALYVSELAPNNLWKFNKVPYDEGVDETDGTEQEEEEGDEEGAGDNENQEEGEATPGEENAIESSDVSPGEAETESEKEKPTKTENADTGRP